MTNECTKNGTVLASRDSNLSKIECKEISNAVVNRFGKTPTAEC